MMSVLQSILVNTFNSDPNARHDAETNLKQYLTHATALSTLICFVGNREIHKDLRQAAAIVMKNNVKDFYRNDEKAIPISQQEKDAIKPLLVDVMIAETDNSVRGILAETIKNVAEFEYPERYD